MSILRENTRPLLTLTWKINCSPKLKLFLWQALLRTHLLQNIYGLVGSIVTHSVAQVVQMRNQLITYYLNVPYQLKCGHCQRFLQTLELSGFFHIFKYRLFVFETSHKGAIQLFYVDYVVHLKKNRNYEVYRNKNGNLKKFRVQQIQKVLHGGGDGRHNYKISTLKKGHFIPFCTKNTEIYNAFISLELRKKTISYLSKDGFCNGPVPGP